MQEPSQEIPQYTRIHAVQLAEVSVEFLERCETERLIEVRTASIEEPAYSAQDVRRLALIRRLHEVLGIRLQDLEVVLYLRSQLLELQEQMQEIERQSVAREEQLLQEMLEMRRRLAEEADWK